tara:strand:+ start:62 stop:1177 length:1116 start_codon:yes stop_codon:yes gene_type:complete
MNIKKIILILFLNFNLLFCDENNENAVYLLYPGPNLISFPHITESKSIDTFFESIQNNVISVISDGQIGLVNNNQWIGGLQTIDHLSGYWVIVDEISLLDIEGVYSNSPLYLLNSGANLISYPFKTNQSLINALPSYLYDNIYAIIGENKAALFTENGIFGSLTTFEANKAYWFFMVNPNPFSYNNPNLFSTNNIYHNALDEEIELDYSQSSSQSVFFIENAYINGETINGNSSISAYCNGTKVGGKNWSEGMIDLIAMGDDGYGYTENYCLNNDNISINVHSNNSDYNMLIIGNEKWNNNSISIISISNVQYGDLNFDNSLNISDLIILIEHIIGFNVLTNNHKILISDSNEDGLINITDLILNLELILE